MSAADPQTKAAAPARPAAITLTPAAEARIAALVRGVERVRKIFG